MGEASRPEAGLLYQVLQQLQDLLQGEGVEEKGRQEGHVAAVVEVVEEEQQGVLAVLPGQVKAEADTRGGSVQKPMIIRLMIITYKFLAQKRCRHFL